MQGADWRKYATYLQSRPDAAETEAVAMLLELCRTVSGFGCILCTWRRRRRSRCCGRRKAEGLPVTVETCPHYLHFAAEEIADGATLTKCAPPIRSAGNREALWEGLREGVIDLVATDHSPCPEAMKGWRRGGLTERGAGLRA